VTGVLLHDAPTSSNAQKVRFMLAELGLAYERRTVPFVAGARPDWHLAVNPTGGIPALVDGDLHLAESNAILRYLASRERRDDLYPTSLPDRARIDWLLEAVGMTLRPILREVEGHAYGLRAGRGIGAAQPDLQAAAEALARLRPRLEAFAALLDPDGDFACRGRFTLADVAGAPMLHRLRRSGLDLSDAPTRLIAWGEAVCTRPAWQPVAAESGV